MNTIISQHPFGSNAYQIEQLEKERAEREQRAKERAQILSGCPTWLQVCLEALWNCTDNGTANTQHVEAALDAAELVSKHAAGLSGSGLGDAGSELAIARHVVQAIATSKPAGYKLRVRAARLLCESSL
jgi:hypothetical protein